MMDDDGPCDDADRVREVAGPEPNVVDTANGPYALFATSIVSTFRCVPRNGGGYGDIDLVALVRRAWYGTLKRNAGGTPHAVTFRFPRLCVGGHAHTSVSCTVNRSGHVLVMSTTFVEDVPALIRFIHAFLAPHVCAVGAGAELEISIASEAPLEVVLVHFNAVIRPAKESGGDTVRRRRQHPKSVRLRRLRDLIEQWWSPTAMATTDAAARPRDGGTAKHPRSTHDDKAANEVSEMVPEEEALPNPSANWADVFSFSSVVPHVGGAMHAWTAPNPQTDDIGIDTAVTAHAPHKSLPPSSPEPIPTTVPTDLADLRTARDLCSVAVLPTRSDQTEIRLHIARRVVATAPEHNNESPSLSVTLLLKHTGTMFVAKAASMGDVAWVLRHVVGSLLKSAADD